MFNMSEGVLELLRVMFTIIWILAAGGGIPLIGHKLFKRCDISSVACEWKGTKKAYIWFAIWITLFVAGNAAVFIVFTGDIWDGDPLALIFFMIYLAGGNVVLAAIYLAVKYMIRAYYGKKDARRKTREKDEIKGGSSVQSCRIELSENPKTLDCNEKPQALGIQDSPDSPDEHDADGPNGEEK